MDLKIYLADNSQLLVAAWAIAFGDSPNIIATKSDYFDIEADAMVSPANSFGYMDGGLDRAIRYELGESIEKRVQNMIVEKYHGELPIGSAEIVLTDHPKWPHLIVAPTMRVPQDVSATINAYLSFRAILLAIKKWT